jgi:hypothetical protein
MNELSQESMLMPICLCLKTNKMPKILRGYIGAILFVKFQILQKRHFQLSTDIWRILPIFSPTT